jgi:hypothetical protein
MQIEEFSYRRSLLALITVIVGFSANPQSAIPNPQSPEFTNVTPAAGITFRHRKSQQGISTILEEAGPGVCVLDYNNDGWLDIYFVNGRDLYNRGLQLRNALYRNNGNGTFTDVTEKAGVPGTAYGIGCVAGDYDNDGFSDLYVTQYGKCVLYRNNNDGTFTDVTDKAGVGAMDFGAVFHSGATFFDYDRDGRLDLYVGSYVTFNEKSRRTCLIGNGIPTSCPPSVYPGSAATLYHNNGDGTFTNVTRPAKMFQPNGKNLSVGACDYDHDGWPDLFVANDGVEAYLYRNNKDGTFTDVAMTAGIALTAEAMTMAAMCISHGDYDNNGTLDLYISDFQAVPNRVFRNDDKGFYDEVSSEVGIADLTRQVLSFGGGFFDYDNDGWLDLFIANGHVYPEVEQATPGVRYKQINQLFRNDGKGKFIEMTKAAGNGFSTAYAARGAAFADFNNDGNLDIVVANNDDPPLLLRNSGAPGHHFLNLKLIGAKSNREATGARVKIKADGLRQIREISAGGSYFSHCDLRAHFGVGRSTKIELVEITWPNGLRQSFPNLEADKFYLIVEGKEQITSQKFTPSLR